MSRRNNPARSTSRALAMACAAVIPSSILSSVAYAASPIDQYQFTNDTFNPTTVAPNLVATPISYVNATPSQPPFGDPPFIAQGGTLPDDPPYFVGQGDWFPSTLVANQNYYTFNVSVPPGMAINVSSFSFLANSRQMVPFLTEVQYSTDPAFSNPVNFDTNPIAIPTQQVWNSFSASDAPITNGVGTYYFQLHGELDPSGNGTISDLLNLGNIALNGAVQPFAGATPMYWDPANTGTLGSGGTGTWIGANSWADGRIDYPWGNTIAEIANFGGASGGTVALGSNTTAVNGINFTTAGYNITGTAGQTLTVSGTITTTADATISAALTSAGAGALVKAGPATLTLAGNATIGSANTVQIIGGTLALGSGGVLSTSAVTGSGTSAFSFNGGTLQTTTNNFTLFSGITSVLVQNAGATIDTGSNNVALAQSILPAAGSTGGLVKLGTGNLIFGDTNNINVAYNAGAVIDVEAGLLTGSSNYQGIWTSNLASLNVAAGASFNAVEAGPTGTIQIDALTGAGSVLGGYFATTTIIVGAANGSGTFSGLLEDNAVADGTLAITKVGAGTQTFSGTNTYTGNTTVSGGTLKFLNSDVPSAAASITSGAILEYNASGRVFQNPLTYAGAGTLRKTGGGDLILGGFGNVNVNFSPGAIIDVEAGELTGSSSFQGIFTSNFASLNIASGALFDAVEAGTSGTMQFDALTGAGIFQGGFFGTTTITLGIANGSGVFSGTLQDDPNAHLAIVKSGTGTQAFSGSNTYTGGTTVSGGTLIIGSATSLPNSTVTVNANTTLQLALGIGPVNVQSLAIVGDGHVDITNNRLIINFGSGADPITAIKTELKSGYNNGSWTGVGIQSSAAAANTGKFAVGYLDGNNPADAANKTVGPNQVVVKYTLAGDAFLENSVGFDDLVVVAQNFGKTGKDWAGGNFNYDPAGSVGFADLVSVAQNFGFSSGVTTGEAGGGLSPAWTTAQSQAPIPEPAAAGLILVSAGGVLARRRRSDVGLARN